MGTDETPTRRTTTTPPSETEPQDLHVPEHDPPSMPEAADKPDAADEKRSRLPGPARAG
jgi:hypothetical protein